MRYPYPAREVIVDAVVHALGLGFGGVGVALLLDHVLRTGGTAAIAGTSIYAGFLLLALTASAAFHMLPWERPRPLLNRIDHAAIYLKIAGTYTPLVIFIGSAFAYVVLAVVWAVALFGAVAKLSFWATDARWSLALYLGMGWAAVLLAWPMWLSLPGPAMALIALGGGLYTFGTFFFVTTMPFQNAIWHGFVLSASTCFFAAIALSLPGTAA